MHTVECILSSAFPLKLFFRSPFFFPRESFVFDIDLFSVRHLTPKLFRLLSLESLRLVDFFYNLYDHIVYSTSAEFHVICSMSTNFVDIWLAKTATCFRESHYTIHLHNSICTHFAFYLISGPSCVTERF